VNLDLKIQLHKSPKSVWDAPTESILKGNSPKELPGAWQIMLLGDGSPTRHLQLLTGHDVEIELIGMSSVSKNESATPKEVLELKTPLIKRQVWLNCNNITLAWAESWWNEEQAKLQLKNKNQPIWKSLTQGRYELFREVDGLALVNESWLEKKFNIKGPFWSRHYRFFRQNEALTVIREVFNPKLELWLGETERK
tara:strand:- start:1260 stop:1847 length:588 start_codon:yes stop_codon:yes gene_type:complete